MTDTEAPLLPLPEPDGFIDTNGGVLWFTQKTAIAYSGDIYTTETVRACVLADRAARVSQQQDAEEIRWRCLEMIALGCSGNPSKDATDALVESGFWNTAQGDSVVPTTQPPGATLEPGAGVVREFADDLRRLAKLAAANRGIPLAIPDSIAQQMHAFMLGKPCLFDRIVGASAERSSEGDREARVEMPANGASVGSHNVAAESPKTGSGIQGRSSEREAG